MNRTRLVSVHVWTSAVLHSDSVDGGSILWALLTSVTRGDVCDGDIR